MINIIKRLGIAPENFLEQAIDFLWAKYTGMTVVFSVMMLLCFTIIWQSGKIEDEEHARAIRNVALFFMMAGIIGLLIIIPKLAELYASPDVTALMWVLRELE